MFERCPQSPNCVSSQQPNTRWFIEPFILAESSQESWAAFCNYLGSESDLNLTSISDTSLEATATTLIFRFTDDLSFELDSEQSVVHVRSASRVGYYDLGTNRRRLEKLRQELIERNILQG